MLRLLIEIAIVAGGIVAMLFAIPDAVRGKRVHRNPDRPERPADLVRLERLVVTGRSTAGDVHLRLRPVLQEIAAARLRPHGVELERNPQDARRLLGDELWEIVRVDRPWPPEPRAPGVSWDQLTSVIARLEQL
ncbi:MAG: hypothetical protein M3076_19825 [Actinomycetota bacterium]|nr:hypothetical protein [Actinomycetota bacterium]